MLENYYILIKLNIRLKVFIRFLSFAFFNCQILLGGHWSFTAFRPRFAGKCDRPSSDLTQFTSGYNFATTNHPRSSCSNSHLRQHNSEIFNGENEYFFSSTGNRSRSPKHPSRTRSPLSYATYYYHLLYYYYIFIKISFQKSSIIRISLANYQNKIGLLDMHQNVIKIKVLGRLKIINQDKRKLKK